MICYFIVIRPFKNNLTQCYLFINEIAMFLFYGMNLLCHMSLLSFSEQSQTVISIMLIIAALGCNVVMNSILTANSIYSWYQQRKKRVVNIDEKIETTKAEHVVLQDILNTDEHMNLPKTRKIIYLAEIN